MILIVQNVVFGARMHADFIKKKEGRKGIKHARDKMGYGHYNIRSMPRSASGD